MVKDWVRKVEHELRETLTRPGSQLTRGQRFIRLCIDLGRHARRELRNHSAPTMAAALTYRTIFGMIPMIVMALIVFRAFGGFAGSQDGLKELVYDYLQLKEEVVEAVEVMESPPQAPPIVIQKDPVVAPPIDGPVATQPLPKPQAKPIAGASWFGKPLEVALEKKQAVDDAEFEAARASAEMKARIDDLVGGLAEGATSISFGSIGIFGMLLLIWAALGLIVTVEKTFNEIFNAPAGRPWHVRIPIYWAIITLGPVLIWASYYLSNQLYAAADGVVLIGWLLGLVNHFTALLVTWLLFLLLFKLMPNAQVSIRPAMAGAMVSALSWELMKAALRWYIDSAVLSQTQSALYGSLALIPLLLFWVYLTWMVVLLGLQVTYLLQTLPANRMGQFEKARPTPVARDPWLVIPVMSAVAQAFDRGEAIGIDAVADQLGAPSATVAKIAEELVGRGLLHRLSVSDGPPTLSLAMPPGKIRIADLIATGPGDELSDLPGHDLLMQLAQAQDAALADITLASRPED